MSKPQATYLRSRTQDRTNFQAVRTKKHVALSNQRDLRAFYARLDRRSEEELDDWHRSMAALADNVSRGEILSKSEKTKKRLADVFGAIRSDLEDVKDYRQLHASLQAPARLVITTPVTGVDMLALAIALTKLAEGFLKLRRRRL